MVKSAEELFEQASAQRRSGDIRAARATLEVLIALHPDLFEARVNLSETCRILGDHGAAIVHLERALTLNPTFGPGQNGLGLLFRKTGDIDRAESCFRKAVALLPENAEVHNNLGTALRTKRLYSEAIESFKRALRLNDRYADGYYNLANCLRDIEQFDEAIACYRMAVELQPLFPEAMSNLAEALQTTGSIFEAQQWFKRVMEYQPANAMVFSNYLLSINYDPGLSARQVFEAHRGFASAFQSPRSTGRSFAKDRTPDRTISVGFVSADFRHHPVACFLKPFFEHRRRGAIEISCYSGVTTADETTAFFQSSSDHWVDAASLSDDDLAGRIAADGIDILIDLSGHSEGNRLPVFAMKPAPVQATYLGYPNTSGLTAMDFRITDPVADPPDAPSYYTEKPVHLSPAFCCFDPPADAPIPGEPPCLAEGVVTFGSTHTLPRLNESVIDLWADLLLSTPNSRLLLARTSLKGKALARIMAQFASKGILEDRLVIQNAPIKESHLSVYRRIDISLDSFPWSGHTTVCESLWMGVPVITLRGNRYAGRVAASVLSSLGMDDWIADSKEAYVKIAGAKAQSKDDLQEHRHALRDRMRQSPLCDGEGFARRFENALREMWKSYCDTDTKSQS